MAKFIAWLKSIPNTVLIWCYWKSKALHQIFYRRLWAQRIAYERKLQADMAESNSKAVALEVAARICKDSGMCALKNKGYVPIISDEELGFVAGHSEKEKTIADRLAVDLGREDKKD